MKRVPEPEDLMDDAEQALAYAEADFTEARDLFLDAFAELHPGGYSGQLLDLGCGPADIPIALADRYPELHADAVDGAPAMLEQARNALAKRPELSPRIKLIQDLLPSSRLASKTYDAIVSNSLLHHLKDPSAIWSTVKEGAKPGAAVCVMDLLRPADEAIVDSLVNLHATDAPPVLKRDFRNSLFAAYEISEVEAQLKTAGLNSLKVRQISDRHLLVTGFLPH